jgi:hypothetical protein
MRFIDCSGNDPTVSGVGPHNDGADTGSSCHPSRRQFLAGLAAVSAAACSTSEPAPEGAAAQGAAGNPGDQIPDSGNNLGRISVHHHYAPPMWVKVLTEADALNFDAWKGWH